MTLDSGNTAALGRTSMGAALKTDLVRLLELAGHTDIQALYRMAYEAKKRTVGAKVYFRALIELSNVCSKDCGYCGIRSGNKEIERYTLDPSDALRMAKWADAQDYGSLVLQAGERSDEAFIQMVEDLVRQIKKETRLGITLSLGEQSESAYRRWYEAGAHRYLLRIETSSRDLYRAIHPADHSFEARLDCLRLIRQVGYQVGTGVMIGLPGQTASHLADDVLFFKDLDVDMIGMGPYLPHSQTPLGSNPGGMTPSQSLEMGLKMIAVTRLMMPDINIAATTALQALKDDGRELGLKAGANVIMPNVTDTEYRAAYQLYENKPCIDENAAQCRGCLRRRIESAGETIGLGEWGDSLHFHKRMRTVKTPEEAMA